MALFPIENISLDLYHENIVELLKVKLKNAFTIA